MSWPSDKMIVEGPDGLARFVDLPGHGDEAALTKFEALVLAQRPAESPWQPVTDYTYAARYDVDRPTADLIASTFRPQAVLDAGCGYGHLLMILRGLGIYGEALDLQKRWPKTITGWRYDLAGPPSDMQTILAGKRRDPFHLVICREVLEHMTIRQIRRAVTNLCTLTERFVYLTTRFAPAPQHLLDVATSDDLDPTHITLLNQSFLRLLFVLEGFKRRSDLEALMDWKKLNRVLVYERT